MNLEELKQKHVRDTLGIPASDFPKAIAFIDFGNVDYWYERDEQAGDGTQLPPNQRLAIDLRQLKDFLALFCDDIRFYYGHDPSNQGSVRFIMAARHVFGKYRVFTKPIQRIKHYLAPTDFIGNTRVVGADSIGRFVTIYKCNFDVEISVDTMRLEDKYDTFCLLSSDADFASLLQYLKSHKKKIILVKSGYIQGALGVCVDAKVNAQDIKQYITMQKQRPGSREPGLAER